MGSQRSLSLVNSSTSVRLFNLVLGIVVLLDDCSDDGLALGSDDGLALGSDDGLAWHLAPMIAQHLAPMKVAWHLAPIMMTLHLRSDGDCTWIHVA